MWAIGWAIGWAIILVIGLPIVILETIVKDLGPYDIGVTWVGIVFLFMELALGGLGTALTLWKEKALQQKSSLVQVTIGWIIGVPVTLALGKIINVPIDDFSTAMVINGIIGGCIGGSNTAWALWREKALQKKSSLILTTIGWGVGGAAGAVIGLTAVVVLIITNVAINSVGASIVASIIGAGIVLTIAGAVIGAIGGLVTTWRLRNDV